MTELAGKAVILGIIGAGAALLLAVVNHFAEPVIEAREAETLRRTLSSLSPDQAAGEPIENPAPGILKRWIGRPDGVWILELSAKGYGGPMIVAASFDGAGTVLAAKLLGNDETVGFGKRAEEPGYTDVFVGTGGSTPIPLRKTDLGTRSDTVSGATVTFSGIARALAAGSEYAKNRSSDE